MGAAFAIRTWQPRARPCADANEECHRVPLWELFWRPVPAAAEDRRHESASEKAAVQEVKAQRKRATDCSPGSRAVAVDGSPRAYRGTHR